MKHEIKSADELKMISKHRVCQIRSDKTNALLTLIAERMHNVANNGFLSCRIFDDVLSDGTVSEFVNGALTKKGFKCHINTGGVGCFPYIDIDWS
jgi:hypothetical protein